VEARLEVRDVAGVLGEQIFLELLPAVHLHGEAAEVAEELLSRPQDLAPLTPQRPRRRGAAAHGARRWRGLLCALFVPAKPFGHGKTRHLGRL
jgi:hypothetical protein